MQLALPLAPHIEGDDVMLINLATCSGHTSRCRHRRGVKRAGVDPKAVATLILASLDGALMMSRLLRSDEALLQVQMHLNRYMDNEVAAS